jgi:hypothetical protein
MECRKACPEDRVFDEKWYVQTPTHLANSPSEDGLAGFESSQPHISIALKRSTAQLQSATLLYRQSKQMLFKPAETW